MVKTINDMAPKLGENTWVAETAAVMGDVECGQQCSFWYGAVVRGDVNSIRIGDRTNVQDNAVIHCSYGKASTTIGSDVTIGHNAIVHGCVVHDKALIGMGAVVMDHAIVEEGAIVAAGAVVLEGTHIPKGAIFAGMPAKLVKQMDPNTSAASMAKVADQYIMYSKWHR